MDKNDIEIFKNELRNYDYYLERIRSINELIDICYYSLTGVHGIDYEHQKSSFSPELTQETVHRVHAEIERHRANIQKTYEKIKEVDSILDQLPSSTCKACIMVYRKGISMERVAAEIGYSHRNSLRKAINNELKKIER